MRWNVLAAAAFTAIAVAGTSTEALAYDPGQPYCMRTRQGGDDCSYYSFRQCQATSRGLGTTCFANPAYAYGRGAPRYDNYYEEPRPRRRYRQRDYY